MKFSKVHLIIILHVMKLPRQYRKSLRNAGTYVILCNSYKYSRRMLVFGYMLIGCMIYVSSTLISSVCIGLFHLFPRKECHLFRGHVCFLCMYLLGLLVSKYALLSYVLDHFLLCVYISSVVSASIHSNFLPSNYSNLTSISAISAC